MKGEAVKCDNCGNMEFTPDSYSRYGRLAFIFKDLVDGDEEEDEPERTSPVGWMAVSKEVWNKRRKVWEEQIKHFCSTDCLEFAVRYTYGNKEVPTTKEREQ